MLKCQLDFRALDLLLRLSDCDAAMNKYHGAAVDDLREKVYHYKRWLHLDMTILHASSNPAHAITRSISSQPFNSKVRKDMADIYTKTPSVQAAFGESSVWIRERIMGGSSKFSALLQTLHGMITTAIIYLLLLLLLLLHYPIVYYHFVRLPYNRLAFGFFNTLPFVYRM